MTRIAVGQPVERRSPLGCHPEPLRCHSERSEESRSAAQGKLREGSAFAVTRLARKRESTQHGSSPSRGDDVFILDGKPVILIPALDGVENRALHRIGDVRGVLAVASVLNCRACRSAGWSSSRALSAHAGERKHSSSDARQPRRLTGG